MARRYFLPGQKKENNASPSINIRQPPAQIAAFIFLRHQLYCSDLPTIKASQPGNTTLYTEQAPNAHAQIPGINAIFLTNNFA